MSDDEESYSHNSEEEEDDDEDTPYVKPNVVKSSIVDSKDIGIQGDEDADEEYYLGHENNTNKSISVNKLSWLKSEYGYPSYERSIPIPPPKF